MNLSHHQFKGELMDKSDLIEASRDTEVPIRKAKEVVKTVFNSMANPLTDGERMEIRGFASFKVKHYDGYTGKNPKTGKPIKVKAKKLPFFKCGKDLKEKVGTYK